MEVCPGNAMITKPLLVKLAWTRVGGGHGKQIMKRGNGHVGWWTGHARDCEGLPLHIQNRDIYEAVIKSVQRALVRR